MERGQLKGACDVIVPPTTRLDLKREILGAPEAMHIALRIAKTILACM